MTDTVDDIQIPEVDENNEPMFQQVRKPHPALLTMIVSNVMTLTEDDPSVNELEALYLFVKKYLQNPDILGDRTNITDAIFSYYLESYRALRVYQRKAEPSDPNVYSEAALSLFDLYLHIPADNTVKQLLTMGVKAIHKVISHHQSIKQERPMMEIIGDLSTLALLSETVNMYIKRHRAGRNFPYIRWLKTCFKKALSVVDLSYMKEDAILKIVLEQVMKSERVITIPSIN